LVSCCLSCPSYSPPGWISSCSSCVSRVGHAQLGGTRRRLHSEGRRLPATPQPLAQQEDRGSRTGIPAEDRIVEAPYPSGQVFTISRPRTTTLYPTTSPWQPSSSSAGRPSSRPPPPARSMSHQ
jgi:hypothetical protein